MFFSRCFSAAVLAACALPAAAEHAPPVELPAVNVEGVRETALTTPGAAEARRDIERTPGGVDLVSSDEWAGTEARTLKDVLDFTPGVIAQPKWGEDSRLSIRGSGMSRNFHLRGVQLLVDGIPMNAADGSADFQEIDPTAFAYTEVYKGANALRYGANALGGAINFVSPTGYTSERVGARLDGGSFGLQRAQLSGGGRVGNFDGFASAAYLEQDGFRDHSEGESRRASGNLGWRILPNLETRLYLLGSDLEQRIPGSVTRSAALGDPRAAAANNLLLNYQRNIQSWRVANRTVLKLDALTAEFGFFAVEKALIHPIFQYLDYQYNDRGAFARVLLAQAVAGHENRLTLGANLLGGRVDNRQFQNLPGGERGDLLSASADRSRNLVLYAEDAFSLSPSLDLIAGLQYLDARRERRDRFNDAVDTSGRADYDFASPKLGLLWRASDQAQVFANLSRSGEPPSFGELNFTNMALADTRAQRATTLEVGARGQQGHDLQWDVSVYRAELRDEFQFFDLGGGNFSVTNADRTVHQGLEAGLAWTLIHDLLAGQDHTRLLLAYTFNDFFFDDDASWGRNELPGAPRHYLRAELKYRHPSGVYAGPNLEWVPQAYDVDNANSQETRKYALLGLRAGYDTGGSWSLYVDARNLSDRRYISSASVAAVASETSTLYEPGSGRAIFAGLRLHW
ncbi:MAG: TonB-dependent receptor family protein [Panacagrimonas sp.]